MAGTLTLPLSDHTQRKLKALAMLCGENVGSLEAELSAFLDEIITQRCAELLGIEQGPSYTLSYPSDLGKEEGVKQPPTASTKSFAEAERAAAGQRSEEVEEAFAGIEVHDEISGHDLSADPDTQDNKSLEEQASELGEDPEEEEALVKALKHKSRNVGKNTEAFLDAAFADEEADEDESEMPSVRARGYGDGGPRSAAKSFETRRRKGGGARITYHTGDDE